MANPAVGGSDSVGEKSVGWRAGRTKGWIAVAVMMAVAIISAWWWYAGGRETTDDAQVDGNVMPIAAKAIRAPRKLLLPVPVKTSTLG